jgi:NADH:ubiquinone oxidoreductase subunit
MDKFDQIMQRFDRIEELLGEIKPRRKTVTPTLPEYEEYMTLYNTTFSRKVGGDEKTRRQLNARLKEGYTLAQMKTAMIEARKEPHHIEAKFKWLTCEFFTRPKTLQLYAREPEKKQVHYQTYDDLQKNR